MFFSIRPRLLSTVLIGPLPCSRIFQPYIRTSALVQNGMMTSIIKSDFQPRDALAMQ